MSTRDESVVPFHLLEGFTNERLVDYILVLGAGNEIKENIIDGTNHSNIAPENARYKSNAYKYVTDIIVIYKRNNIPDGYDFVAHTDGRPADLNYRSMGSEIYLAFKRGATTTADNGYISNVTIIFTDRGDIVPPNYNILDYNLNKGSFGRTVQLCIERDNTKDPITDLVIIDIANNERCGPEYYMIDKNINQGSFGHPLYLCIKHTKLAYTPKYESIMLSRFPEHDIPDSPLPENGIPMLCFPQGLQLKEELQLPYFFSLLITGANGEELHGAALKFFEPIIVEVPILNKIDENGNTYTKLETKTMFCPKVLCLISHWPFHDSFASFLKQIYQISLSPYPHPIEHVLAHFLKNTPLPLPGGARIEYSIGHSLLSFYRPSYYYLPIKDFSFRPLFESLDIRNVLKLICYVIAERKIILYSSNYAILSPVAESLRTLIFPLQWQYTFVPILPSILSYILQAPVPLIVGVHRNFLDDYRVNSEMVLVDLDMNMIRIPKESSINNLHTVSETLNNRIEFLPEGLNNDMLEQLKQCCNIFKKERGNEEPRSLYISRHARDLSIADNIHQFSSTSDEDIEVFDEREIQDIFLRLFVFLFQDYRHYLLPIMNVHHLQHNQSHSLPFDIEKFLKSFPNDLIPFMKQMSENQAFASFIMDRSIPCRDAARHKQLFFFDWCIAIECAVDLDPKYYLKLEGLLTGARYKPKKISPLEDPISTNNVPEQQYRYATFPKLDSKKLEMNETPVWTGSIMPLSPTSHDNPSSTSSIIREAIVLTCQKLVNLQETYNININHTYVQYGEHQMNQKFAAYIIELWLDIHLNDIVNPDHNIARLNLLQILYNLGQLIQNGALLSARSFLVLCSFCCEHELVDEFQLIYRMMSTFFPQQHPPPVFFYQCLVAEGAFMEKKRIHLKNYHRSSRFEAPEQIWAHSRCNGCGYEVGGEHTMMLLSNVVSNNNNNNNVECYQILVDILYNRKSSSNKKIIKTDENDTITTSSTDMDNSNSIDSPLSPYLAARQLNNNTNDDNNNNNDTNNAELCPRCKRKELYSKLTILKNNERKNVQLIHPQILRDAFLTKRKFFRRYININEGEIAEGKSVKLRDISTIQWIRCVELLTWNLSFYFALLDLPIGILFTDNGVALHLQKKLTQSSNHTKSSTEKEAQIQITPRYTISNSDAETFYLLLSHDRSHYGYTSSIINHDDITTTTRTATTSSEKQIFRQSSTTSGVSAISNKSETPFGKALKRMIKMLKQRKLDNDKVLAVLETIREILSQPFDDDELDDEYSDNDYPNSNNGSKTVLTRIGQIDLIDDLGYPLIDAIVNVLTRGTYSKLKTDPSGNPIIKTSVKVVTAAVKLLCIMSCVQLRNSLFRNLGEPLELLDLHSTESQETFISDIEQKSPRVKHLRRSSSTVSIVYPPDSNDEGSPDSQSTLNVLASILSTLSFYKKVPLIAKAGLLVILNGILRSVANEANKKKRIQLFIRHHGLQVIATVMRRNEHEIGVNMMCISVLCQLLDMQLTADMISKMNDSGIIDLITHGLRFAIRSSHMSLIQTCLQFFFKIITHNDTSSTQNNNGILDHDLIRLTTESLYHYCYLPDIVLQQHNLGLALTCLDILNIMASSTEVLLDEGVIQRIGATLSIAFLSNNNNDNNNNNTDDEIAQKLQLKSSCLGVVEKMLSYTLHKVERRVLGLVTMEDGIISALESALKHMKERGRFLQRYRADRIAKKPYYLNEKTQAELQYLIHATGFALHYARGLNKDILRSSARCGPRMFEAVCRLLLLLLELHFTPLDYNSFDTDTEDNISPGMDDFIPIFDEYQDLVSRAIIGITNLLQSLDAVIQMASETQLPLSLKNRPIRRNVSLPQSPTSMDDVNEEMEDLILSRINNGTGSSGRIHFTESSNAIESNIHYKNLRKESVEMIKMIDEDIIKNDSTSSTKLLRAIAYFKMHIKHEFVPPSTSMTSGMSDYSTSSSVESSLDRYSNDDDIISDNNNDKKKPLEKKLNNQLFSPYAKLSMHNLRIPNKFTTMDKHMRKIHQQISRPNIGKLVKSQTVSALRSTTTSSKVLENLRKHRSSRNILSNNINSSILSSSSQLSEMKKNIISSPPTSTPSPHHIIETQKKFLFTETSSDDDNITSSINNKWANLIHRAENRVRDGDNETFSDALVFLRSDVEELLINGIPSKLRYLVWASFTGAWNIRETYPVDYYDQLVQSYEAHGSASSAEIHQDLHRTLPSVQKFRTSIGQAELERVLGAYSLLDPDVVGYCQSMNVIAATLLTFLDEEQAFWILVALMRQYVGYYTKTMCNVSVDQRVLEDLFSFNQPELNDHIKNVDARISMFTVSWFMCLYAEAPLPLSNIGEFWDYLFVYGDEILFHTALSLLHLKHDKIMCIKDLGEMMDFGLHGGICDGIEWEQIRNSINLNDNLIKRVTALRKFHRTQVLLENSTVDSGFAQSLMTTFGFDNENEIQLLWQHFLSPSPWEILQISAIQDELHFQTAFCPLVYTKRHRNKWRDHGLFCGIVPRLFKVLDRYYTGRVSLPDFVRGVAILKKASINKRIKLCFEFFDSDDSGIIDRNELTQWFLAFHEMYCGNSNISHNNAKKLTNHIFKSLNLVKIEHLTFDNVVSAVKMNPYVTAFFRLGTNEEIDQLISTF